MALDCERDIHLTPAAAPLPPPLLDSFSVHVSPGFAAVGMDIAERNMTGCKFREWAAGRELNHRGAA